jgi:hypothetical protein
MLGSAVDAEQTVQEALHAAWTAMTYRLYSCRSGGTRSRRGGLLGEAHLYPFDAYVKD